MHFPFPVFDYFKFENFYKKNNKPNIYEFKNTNNLVIFSSLFIKKKYYLAFFGNIIQGITISKNYFIFLITEKVPNPRERQEICLLEINDEEKPYDSKILFTFWLKEGNNAKFSLRKFIEILKNF
jgi:hypothetical protein